MCKRRVGANSFTQGVYFQIIFEPSQIKHEKNIQLDFIDSSKKNDKALI